MGPDWFPSGRLRLNRDRGLAESWGYVQTLAAAALLLVVHRRSGDLLALAWAGVLVIVVLDDGVFLHERLGNWAAATWDLPAPAGLRPVDVGELGAWALLGIPALGALLLAARRSSSEERRRSLPLLGGFLALVLFAVVVDMVHQAVGGDGGRLLGVDLDPALRFVEALGELLAMTAVLLAAVHRILPGTRRPR